jgi:hypothetical protein
MKKAKPTKPPSEEFARFQEFTRKLIAVPKEEIDQRCAIGGQERLMKPA